MSPPAARAAIAAGLMAVCLPAGGRAQALPLPGLTLADAARTALQSSPDVERSRWNVQARRGELLAARGAFDVLLRSQLSTLRESAPVQGSLGASGNELSSRHEYRVTADRRFRSGWTASPHLSFTRLEVPASGVLSRNAATAGLDFTVPLLRDRGGGLESADERSALSSYRATLHELRHEGAASVLRAVTAYWEYAAALERLEALRRSEERTRRLVEETRTLIKADQRPAVDSITVAASLASKSVARLVGEQAVIAARQALVLAVGGDGGETGTGWSPATPLPQVPRQALGWVVSTDAALAEALRRRADLAGARLRAGAASGLRQAAHAQLRPRLDLTFSVGYTGIEAGSQVARVVAPLSNTDGGYHAAFGLSYGLPVGNRAAAGEALRHEAVDRQAALAAAELSRAISLQVATAVEGLRNSLAALELSDVAQRLQAAAVENESEKFVLGTSTLFDVLYVQDALTSVTMAAIDARCRYAVALARFRYETGTLLTESPDAADPDAPGATVDVAGLMDLGGTAPN